MFGDAARAKLKPAEEAEDKKRNAEFPLVNWVDSWANDDQEKPVPALIIDENSLTAKEVSSAKYPTRDHVDYSGTQDF